MRLRTGIVQEGRAGQVRVLFEDEGITSPWLDVLAAETKGAQAFNRPRPGNLVRVVMDDLAETGVVLGAIYSQADPPPADADTTWTMVFGDGTAISYDETTGTLTLSNAAGADLRIVGQTLTFKGNVAIDGDLTVSGQTTLQGTTINGVGQTGD
ncbi:phage baseplate assembly protein V [Loktanella sp. 3ANDIMAR09]|uniref:phage baseplate assembly protein V n=1 Tax=Loktanella sp. 3ANDIMAR09 TaxID=1225657 RepID=UPI0006F64376|nr:phage baseplate assembly protein V [Loktanella sp. 3ANDIMAR09]